MSWQSYEGLVVCLRECEEQSPNLILHCRFIDEELQRLTDLGIVMDFTADSSGKHFEASFTDPGGLAITLVDVNELPLSIIDACQHESTLNELSIPTAINFSDSVNFWDYLGLAIQPAQAQSHPWAILAKKFLKIGLHQSENWKEPGLNFLAENCPYELPWKYVNEELSYADESSGVRVYSLSKK